MVGHLAVSCTQKVIAFRPAIKATANPTVTIQLAGGGRVGQFSALDSDVVGGGGGGEEHVKRDQEEERDA